MAIHPIVCRSVELETRWELSPEHPYAEHGIDESMSIDASTHSLFGVSKASADLMVQEFGRYFGLKTACFRGGCLTGPGHSGAMLHGFLSYLMKCAVTGDPYRVLGYKGKQVRDNIHSFDLVNAFWCVFQKPRSAEVYNIGGARHANCSMLEAIKMCEDLTGRPMNWSYVEDNRVGDHIWWIGDVRRFQSHYPEWRFTYDIRAMLAEIHDAMRQRTHLGRGGRLMVSIPSGHDWVAAGIPGLLSVVIPARNEAENLQVVVPTLLTALEGAGINHEILVVNDGSTDDTRDVLVRAGGAPR